MEKNEMMVAWAANELPNDTTINKPVSNDGLLIVFSLIAVAGLLPLFAIIFGSAVRRLLRQSNVAMESSNKPSTSSGIP